MASIILLKFLGLAACFHGCSALWSPSFWRCWARRIARIIGGLAVLEAGENEARAAATKAQPCCYEVIVVVGAGVKPTVLP